MHRVNVASCTPPEEFLWKGRTARSKMSRSVLLTLVVSVLVVMTRSESPPIMPLPMLRHPTCDLPKAVGRCRAAVPKYYFDGKKCVKFTYGGCGGNSNNFPSLLACRCTCDVGTLAKAERGQCSSLNGKAVPAKLVSPITPPSVTYTVKVYTGTIKGAGTDANVFIEIGGKKKLLRKSKTNKGWKKFDSGKVDVFEIVAPVSPLDHITIGHDTIRMGPSWFLEKIVIFRNDSPAHEVTFTCQRWLARDKGDKKIRIKLNSLKPSSITYKVKVYTGTRKDAGTDANVFIEIGGKKKLLRKSKTNMGWKKFDTGKVDVFEIVAPASPLYHIAIGHDNIRIRPSWFLEKVVIFRKDSPAHVVTFIGQRWLSRDKGDKKIRIKLNSTQ